MVKKFGQTTAQSGLRLRMSPHDGETVCVLPAGTNLEIVGEATWLQVRTDSGETGFVLSDYVEKSSVQDTRPPAASANIIDFEPQSNRIRGWPIRIDLAFKEYMDFIEQLLEEYDLMMRVTSSLREPNRPVFNAVVEPSKYSNHHVGHAIDMNLYRGSDWFNSDRLRLLDISDPPTGDKSDVKESVRSFLREIHHHPPLRWGGTFSNPDPVHIDSGLNVENTEEYREKYNALWS